MRMTLSVIDIACSWKRPAIELVPPGDAAEVTKARAERRAYLTERGYRVVDVSMGEVEADIAKVLDGLESVCGASPSAP